MKCIICLSPFEMDDAHIPDLICSCVIVVHYDCWLEWSKVGECLYCRPVVDDADAVPAADAAPVAVADAVADAVAIAAASPLPPPAYMVLLMIPGVAAYVTSILYILFRIVCFIQGDDCS